MQQTLNIHIGEVKIAKDGEILKAILGSCVGIGIIWEERKICGLAHCLLPESPTPTFNIGARYVDQAMSSLMALMKIKPGDTSKVEVIIVGGGNMTSHGAKDNSRLVGSHNFRVALREAKKYQFCIRYSDGGGEEGRKVYIDSSDYTFRVEKIPRIIDVA